MNRPLRFCMITTFYPPYNFGGDGLFVQRLSNELAARGHQVEVVHCVDSYLAKAGAQPTGTTEIRPNITVHSLKSGLGALSPLSTQQTGVALFNARAIRKILERRFDVIHYHNISLVGGPAVLGYGTGIKLYTTHEYWLVCPTHLMFRFNRAPCVTPHCFRCSLTYKRPPQWWRYTGVLERAVKHVDAFIGPSRFSIGVHRRMGLDVPFVHLPAFVPRTLDESNRVDIVHEDPYFLFVGRLEKIKGLQTLLPVFKRYKRARLVIAGGGEAETELKRAVAGWSNIEFRGFVEQSELRLLYRRAAALIVPSICYEVFPLVMLEAFREKTPVVARKLGGMAEVIEDSGGGVAYESDDELIAAMDHLLEDASYRTALGTSGYQAFEKNWTPEAHLDRYFELIREIANRKSSNPERVEANPEGGPGIKPR
ncbi:MAG TPA: glycosyltransferase family 4 protein [Blastocatellia bacterium]|nr:glycosyltransferase family 4 protein [Blastocatellia bacterium]